MCRVLWRVLCRVLRRVLICSDPCAIDSGASIDENPLIKTTTWSPGETENRKPLFRSPDHPGAVIDVITAWRWRFDDRNMWFRSTISWRHNTKSDVTISTLCYIWRHSTPTFDVTRVYTSFGGIQFSFASQKSSLFWERYSV